MPIRIQTEDFDLGAEVARLRASQPQVGAVVVFVGTVRDMNEGASVATMELEHYPGMTEKALQAIVGQARARWELVDALVIHRVGLLQPLEQIVLVAVTSKHRGEAFAACEFIMDYLKTQAPFWKKEQTPQGARWVDARVADDEALAKWGPLAALPGPAAAPAPGEPQP
ncbi:molybdopterin synthase catalytic subunit MoaE [Noviherbaspirillum sedimenti]|uniref:Molybdopterin synthase catalytic subunit n=1 Tax=Noviherbaspirillum sedimenti TaxID=2320865 RepID=A0A3A3G052_9BURK|nr:molybdopterin synthase catalytic subunit MoaE [Noviherbaspirillum sedimenti]RJG00279.1 molybdopterin synthase catalytic subunit MoaE [Noviherbaspirillum sedimenti]